MEQTEKGMCELNDRDGSVSHLIVSVFSLGRIQEYRYNIGDSGVYHLMNEKKLGFGMMRLPRRGMSIDIAETSEMVDLFLDAGMTYFDTAFVYPGSEKAVRKALVERHPRDSYTIATKLMASAVPTEGMAKKELETSLKRLGTDYVDYYLLHSLMSSNYQKYEKYHLWDFVKEQKEKGVIRHIGFSFHDGPELLEEILAAHPEAEFVQLQINYADWENPDVQSRAVYETARKFGKPVVIMEPIKGGKLADPPFEVKKLMQKENPYMSPASWAIRFAASLDGVRAVLSGMSAVEQMKDNLSYMKDFVPLSESEQAVIRKAQAIMGKSVSIPCTACSYCTKGCPMQIPIPEIFAAMNKRLDQGRIEEAKADYADILAKGNGADACIECGQCEAACPQHIAIIEQLKKCREGLSG